MFVGLEFQEELVATMTGVARGTGANVKLYEVAVTLGEIVEELV